MKNKLLTQLLGVFAVLVLFLGSHAASAQGNKITGKVVAAKDGDGIPGASVIVKGSKSGVASDANGNFTISAESNSILTVSSVGFASLDVKVGTQTSVTVRLAEETSTLNEVVVTGEPIKVKVVPFKLYAN
jgi:hypothetical protein